MKKSEKVKRKETAEARKKLQVRYGLLVIAGIIVIAVLWGVMFNPLVAKTRDTVAVYYTETLDDANLEHTTVHSYMY